MNPSLLLKLFPGVILLLLLVAGCILYVRSKDLTLSEFKRSVLRRPPFRMGVFLLTILFGGAFVVCYWLNASNSASAVITLNYAEASSAENANGTRYNMAEIICPNVLERAIKRGALENVTVQELQSCVSVEPLVQGNSYDENSYHIATEFCVTYTASSKTRHLDAENVVQLIADAYKEFYIDQYADNFSVLEMEDDPDFSRLDYLDTVAYLDKQASRIMNYMYGMADRSSSFTSSNGDTFNSVAARAYQFNDVQITGNLKSYILHNGISRDAESYIGRLEYENSLLDYDSQRANASFEVRNQAVDMYSEEMTRVVLVPTWDNDGTYYMGRTKVGLDELSLEAETYSKQAAEYLKEIEDNKSVIAALKGSTSSGSDQTADTMIAEIYGNIKSFAVLARTTGQEYSETRMNKCITASIYGVSLTKCLAVCILVSLAFYVTVTILMAARRLPKHRKDGIYIPDSASAPKQEKEPAGKAD